MAQWNSPKFDVQHHVSPSLGGMLSMRSVTRLGWVAAGAFAFTYFLFQKKLLPKSVSRVVSALFFVPTYPITLFLRLNNLWTPIDDTVILGLAPVGFLGHPQKLHKLGKFADRSNNSMITYIASAVF